MADAKRTTVMKLEEVEGVALTLTMEEVAVLRAVLGRVGGSVQRSPRKHVDAIRKTLDEVVPSFYPQEGDPTHLLTGTLRFSEARKFVTGMSF
ncbi:hypothetical protein C9F11_10070 [Streptomyces sp. YIM 121038]|uniref:hypothetical protein n=1 Tax=Streptomyces sp. YIM 121038 TaxID=2136401 RepID=UPI0011105815|nr:hypothetical protein [Streptomyces sp. YIM 121038]QCX75697.1 hypothetical protein C9F11_10070 [Streptomyces sp. YIM 121038]